MDHHLTRPYKRASSTLSTDERGGQRRESQSVGTNAGGGAASTHVGNGFSRSTSSDHHHQHHASPARRVYPVAPTYSSSPYYGHGGGTTEEFKYALRRRQGRSSTGTISQPIFRIFVTIILGSALIICLRYNRGNGANVAVPSQAESTPAQNTVTDEATKDTKLRGGMSKHERAAAALLLADIIVHAEHDAEEEVESLRLLQRRRRWLRLSLDLLQVFLEKGQPSLV